MERHMDKETNNSASDSAQSSDMSFYVIMLALIVCMGFYISYDMEQRYGADISTTADSTDSTVAQDAQEPVSQPVVVGVEKLSTVEVKPVAAVPATETTPQAIVVEKVEQETVVTTAVVPVEAAVVKNESETAPEVVEKKAVADKPVQPSSLMMPIIESAKQAVEVVTAPVVQAAETVAETTEAATEIITEPAPVVQPVQAYNPYDNQYGQPQNNYYQQPQYGNPYGNQYGNPYGNQYNNQYGNPYGNQYNNPYGYGNNPYQQPAQ